MKTLFTFFLLITVFLAPAQNTFKTRLVSTSSGYLTRVVQLTDGGYVSIGYADDTDGDMRLVKLDAAGSVVASKSIATTGYDEAYSVTKTSDGGFVVCGQVNDQTGLLKFKADLTLEWQREYDITGGVSGALQVVQTTDGGYIMVGAVANADEDFAGSVMKINSQGTILFQKRYFNFSNSLINSISPMTDGNYAFIAVASSADNETDTNYVGKMSPDGSLLWVKQFSDATYTTISFSTVIGSSDGGLVVAGTALDSTTAEYSMAMAKFNTSGSITWSKVLQNDNSFSFAYTVAEDRDGGYLFAGIGYDTTAYGYVVKTSSAGVLVSKKTFESSINDYTQFNDLKITSDGGYVACGEGYFSEEDSDFDNGGLIYKFTSSFGACGEAAGTADGSLVSFGATATPQLPVANTSLVAVTDSITIADLDDVIDNACNTLPVHFTSFTAALQSKSVAVSWTTANEINTDYFVVERSANGVAFTSMQSVAAKGGSGLTQAYSATDLQPLQGTSYYRLKEVDKDGKITYSSVVPVTVMSNGIIVISPNPVQSMVHVILQSSISTSLTLQVTDMNGTVLLTQKRSVTTGRNEISIPAASLAKGIYVLKVIDGGSVHTMRFVKE